MSIISRKSRFAGVPAPTMSLTELSNGLLQVSGTAAPNNSIVITWPDGQTVTVVSAADGLYSAVSPYAEGLGSVDVYAINARGARTPKASQSYLPGDNGLVLTADLDPASDVGVSNTDHLTKDATPTIKGTGEANAEIIVTTPTGESLTTTVASDGTWSVTPTIPIPDGDVSFAVTENSIGGNSKTAAVSVVIDTTIANPVLNIDFDVNHDGFITAAEMNGATSTPVTISFDKTKAQVGDVIHVSDNQGVHQDVILTSDDIAAGSVVIPFELPASGSTLTVTAYITDNAGNTSNSEASTVQINTSEPLILTASLHPASDSGVSNSDGITNDTTPTITGTGTAGATVSITMPTGETLTTIVAADGTWCMTPAQALADGLVDIHVSEVKDGLIADVVIPVTIDTSIPTLSISIDLDADNDGAISTAERGVATTSLVSISFDASKAQVGDVMHLNDDAGIVQTVVLTAADIAAGKVEAAFALPVAGSIMGVQAYITDAAGNASAPASDRALIEQDPGVLPLAKLDSASDTGVSNSDGITKDSTPTIIGVGTAGATVTLTTPTGETLTTIVAVDGTWSITPTQAIADGSVSFTIDGVQGAAQAVIDTSISMPVINIDLDTNNDGTISIAERGSATTSQVTISFDPAKAQVGDMMHLSSETGVVQTIFLTAADIAAGKVQTVFSLPAEGSGMSVQAHITDLAGNVSITSSDFAVIQTPPQTDHIITGQEDTALVVHASDLGMTGTGSSIVIDNLPGNGQLQLNGNNVSVGQSISLKDIDAGLLTFMPAANESGFSQYNNSGVGNMMNDYAQFSYHQMASSSSLGVQTMTVDITPVADVASVIIEQTANLNLAPAGHQQTETYKGINGRWEHLNLSLPSSPDSDGSEINRVFVSPVGGLNILALADGTITSASGQYGYELPQGTTQFFAFLPTRSNPLNFNITVMSQEVNTAGTVFDTDTNLIQTAMTSPLVLDLTGNGVHTTSLANGTQFDLNADGVKEHTGWVGNGQGFLAMDLNHDGKIDSGKELFGDHTVKANGTTAKDGYDALSMYDSNHDGVIDVKDVHFKDLLVWVDASHDGISQASELHGLSDLHIASISVQHTNDSTLENGNAINMSSTFTTVDGKTHAMADVYFNTATSTHSTHVDASDLPAALTNQDVAVHNAANSSTLQSMLDSHVLNHAFI